MRRSIGALAVVVSWAAAAAGASSPDPRALAVPTAELARAKALVRLLGSPAYPEREKATAELGRMGRLARPALAAAAADPDPEVRTRAARLLPRAEADELTARLEAFLADAEGKFTHDLPGWKEFTKQAGADDKARALYAAAAKPGSSNLRLLAALDHPPADAGKAVADFRDELLNRTRVVRQPGQPAPPPPTPLTLPEIAVLLAAETAVPYRSIPRTSQTVAGTGVSLVSNAASQKALTGADEAHAGPYRKIVAGWLATRVATEDLSNLAINARNTLGQSLRAFPEYDALLRRVVTSDAMAGYYRGTALAALTDWHKKDEVPTLKKYLGNDTLVGSVFIAANPGRPPIQARCQLRDVALALLIQQTGQDMKEYGFDTRPGQAPNPAEFYTYGFVDDDKRAAALVKFGWWQLKQGVDAAGGE
jgi:hypothetical protein